jgi:hypothetical protein
MTGRIRGSPRDQGVPKRRKIGPRAGVVYAKRRGRPADGIRSFRGRAADPLQRRTAVKVKWFDTNSSMTSPTGAAAAEHVCPAAPTIAGVACTRMRPFVRPPRPLFALRCLLTRFRFCNCKRAALMWFGDTVTPCPCSGSLRGRSVCFSQLEHHLGSGCRSQIRFDRN